MGHSTYVERVRHEYKVYTEQPQPEATHNPTAFWSLPVVLYALFALGIIITPLVGGAPRVLGPSLSLIAIFVMGSPVVFALSRLLTKRSVDRTFIA